MYAVLMSLFNLCFGNAVMPSKWKRLLRILIEHFVVGKGEGRIEVVYIWQKENNIFLLNIPIMVQILLWTIINSQLHSTIPAVSMYNCYMYLVLDLASIFIARGHDLNIESIFWRFFCRNPRSAINRINSNL
jgi:hypothetical protein